MISCEQIPCLLLENLHNFRGSRTTERSDFDCVVHLAVEFPKLDRPFTNRSATRASQNFLTIFPNALLKTQE